MARYIRIYEHMKISDSIQDNVSKYIRRSVEARLDATVFRGCAMSPWRELLEAVYVVTGAAPLDIESIVDAHIENHEPF